MLGLHISFVSIQTFIHNQNCFLLLFVPSSDNNQPGETPARLCAKGIKNLQLLVQPTVQKDLLAGMISVMGHCPVRNLQDKIANVHDAASITMQK